MAELPSSPLSEEYTVADSETIHGEWYHSYEVASGGVLNILGEYAQPITARPFPTKAL